MRCQPTGAIVPSPRRGSLIFILLATFALSGCEDEEGARRGAASVDADAPAIANRINRASKGDRLKGVSAALTPAPDSKQKPGQRLIPGYNAPLSGFYAALSDLQSGARVEPLTILHLGDSHIAADGFSGDLRASFQARFGDAGRGMMMPGFVFPYYKARGVTFARNGKWQAANSFKNDPGPYGLTGVRLSSRSKGAELTLTSDGGVFEWAEVAFLAGPGGGEAKVTFGDGKQSISTHAPNSQIKRVRIRRKGRKVTVTAMSKKTVSLLSWSVGHNRPGIRYVNFGIPGANAGTPSRWDDTLLRDGLAALKPDLIILGYGTNEGFHDGLEEEAYQNQVVALLERLKGGAPNASFLILGPPDSLRFPRFARGKNKKAGLNAPCRALSAAEVQDYARLKKANSKQLARWHAPPNLAVVRASLKSVAEKNGAHFWDWSSVMGSPCGIHAWAKATPPLAASDRVHLRSGGAKRSAEKLFDELMSGYEAHVQLVSG